MGKTNTEQARKLRKREKIIKSIVWGLIILTILTGAYLLLKPEEIKKSEYTQITFSEFYEISNGTKEVSRNLKTLDGKKVILKGYMAEQSPINGSFVYIVNQPYVVCPFCTLGDTKKLEVMYVYMENGTGITFTNDPIEIYGTLEIGMGVDDFGYTTQFKIKASKIETLEEGVSDAKVNSYYQKLNDDGMILDIQVLQMNIDSLTNEETMKNWYQASTKEGIIDAMKAETYFNDNYKDWSEDGNGMRGYINYIKECPSIIAQNDPVDEHLAKVNKDLIELYNKNIRLLETVGKIYIKIQTTEMTTEEKIETYDELLKYKDENMELFDEFNKWNNELRKQS